MCRLIVAFNKQKCHYIAQVPRQWEGADRARAPYNWLTLYFYVLYTVNIAGLIFVSPPSKQVGLVTKSKLFTSIYKEIGYEKCQ